MVKQLIKETTLELLRFTSYTRCRYKCFISFKDETALYGIYYGGDVEGWIPAKWSYPEGKYRLDGRVSDLDLSLPKWWRLKNGNLIIDDNSSTTDT